MSRLRPSLAALRMRLVAAGAGAVRDAVALDMVALGVTQVDARLGGGLARAALHEVFAATGEDASAAAGFALLLALRATRDARPVMWLREDRGARTGGRLYAAGLAELGADPGQFYTVHAADALGLLRAGADIVKCAGVGAVVIEPWGKAPQLDLTASRRLSLAAARSGVMVLVLRAGADPHPSAAATRWQVAAAPSPALAGNAPGAPAFDVEMLRHRGGMPGFAARLEWDRDRMHFVEPVEAPLSGGVPAVPAIRTGETGFADAA